MDNKCTNLKTLHIPIEININEIVRALNEWRVANGWEKLTLDMAISSGLSDYED